MTSDSSADHVSAKPVGEKPVGVVAALRSEARALGVSGPVNEAIELNTGTLVYICGVGPDNARRATEELLAADVAGVVSWGTAGGLAPALAPGAVIVASTIICADAAYEADRDWVARLTECLVAVLPVSRQTIYSGAKLISSPTDKKSLADEFGAIAVDMESVAIAECAASAGKPFVVIRVIADPSSFSMPSAVGAALNREGFISIPRATRALFGRPAEIISVLRLAKYFRRATQALASVYRTAGPRLLGP